MENTEAFEAMKAWMDAKAGLEKAELELRAAKAGHDVASACEREAWEKIAKFCGRESEPPKPPPVPAEARVSFMAPPPMALTTELLSAGRLLPQQSFDTRAIYGNMTHGYRTAAW